MTQSISQSLIQAISNGYEGSQVQLLKDLKNSIIGNTWKKVEAAEDSVLLSCLLDILQRGQSSPSPLHIEAATETAVIVGSLANVGPLTLKPLLQAGVPAKLLSAIKSISARNESQARKALAALMRALRNVLVSTADIFWGHMWGVGAEKKVVGTGLVGDVPMSSKSKLGSGKGRTWKVDAMRSLNLMYEQSNLRTLLHIMETTSDTQTILPLYQLLARLVVLPSHREALARWRPGSAIAGPSRSPDLPFIVSHLLVTIDDTSSVSPASRKANSKLLESGLDLLATLTKGEAATAAAIRNWTTPDLDPASSVHDLDVEMEAIQIDRGRAAPGFMGVLVDLLFAGPAPVRIAAANCLTNIIKADKGAKTTDRVRSTVLNMQLLDVTAKLLKTETLEGKVKLCFILGRYIRRELELTSAALVSDDSQLQQNAAEHGCPELLVEMMHDIDRAEQKGELGADLASRSQEAVLLALASLSFLCESNRSTITDITPPFLPHLLKSLSHSSYGVRAAACQLTRALSRNVAVLRTSLVDSGVGEQIVVTLKREVEARRPSTSSHALDDDEDDMGERSWTVEVAATATICNLIADFSPLKAVSLSPNRTRADSQTVLKNGGIELLCELSQAPYEPLALNALWALKNLTFHALDSLKNQVMAILSWDKLKSLRAQAFEITQNLLAEAQPSDVARTLDLLGGSDFLDILARSSREGVDVDIRVPALYVVSNLALGNEKTRNTVVAKVEILEVLSEAVNARADSVKIPALRALRHLIESNPRTHRPRQSMIDLLQPYQLKARLKELTESSPSLDVCQGAMALLETLDKGRDSPTTATVTGASQVKI